MFSTRGSQKSTSATRPYWNRKGRYVAALARAARALEVGLMLQYRAAIITLCPPDLDTGWP